MQTTKRSPSVFFCRYLMIFLISLLVNGATNVFAAYPTTKAPATLHVPYGLSFGPGIARNKILDGARAKGGEDAYREALWAKMQLSSKYKSGQKKRRLLSRKNPKNSRKTKEVPSNVSSSALASLMSRMNPFRRVVAILL